MFKWRSDGKVASDIDPFMRIIPYIMKERNDAMTMIFEDVECTGMDAYMRANRETRSYNYMHIIIAAMVRAIYLKPELNRFVINGRLYQRDKVWVSFAVHRSLRGDMAETTIKIPFEGNETLAQIADIVDDAIEVNTAKDDENDTDKLARFIMALPAFLIKFAVNLLMWMDRHNICPKSVIAASPFHTTFFITNLKSLGIDTIFHHLYNFGTTGQFVSMGKEHYKASVTDRQIIEIKKIMRLGIVTDERVCDGLTYARATKTMKRFVRQPELLEEPAVRK